METVPEFLGAAAAAVTVLTGVGVLVRWLIRRRRRSSGADGVRFRVVPEVDVARSFLEFTISTRNRVGTMFPPMSHEEIDSRTPNLDKEPGLEAALTVDGTDELCSLAAQLQSARRQFVDALRNQNEVLWELEEKGRDAGAVFPPEERRIRLQELQASREAMLKLCGEIEAYIREEFALRRNVEKEETPKSG